MIKQECAKRVLLGWQCPECYGIRINVRQPRFDPSPIGWLCEECGCQWSPPVKSATQE